MGEPHEFATKVLGIDLGTQSARVALLAPHQRMPTIVRNNFSLESTPSVVAFDEAKRHVGEEGVSKITSRPKWAANLLRLLFRGDPSDTLGLQYTLVGDRTLETPHGSFDVVHLLAMLFHTLFGYARKGDGCDDPAVLPKQVIVSVPRCTPAAQALLAAALEVVGMPPAAVSVATDGAAAAVCYRGLRFDALAHTLEEAKPFAVVDVGHGFHSVAVAKAARDGVAVLGEASGPVGSFSIDRSLLAQLLADTEAKHKQSFDGMPKQLARLTKESQKAKEMMSTLAQTTMHVDALTDTFDLSFPTKQEDVLGWSKALREGLDASIAAALAEAGVAVADLAEVQVIGGGWRTPCIATHIKTALGRQDLNVHLDPVQTVAQGCALLAVRRDEPGEGAARDEEVNGVHYFSFTAPALPEAPPLRTEEEVAAIKEAEAKVRAAEAIYQRRMNARNALESYILSLPTLAYDASLPEGEVEAIEAKVRTIDDWMLSEEGEAAEPEELARRLDEVKADVAENHKKIAEHLERRRLEEEEKDRKLAEEAKLAKETKEPKTDPQRLKAAQERREQGVKLFKQEEYVDAVTRFVQALAHLKDIYDLDNADNKKRRNEIALSCHLNIASASLKLKKYNHAEKNCTQALDFDADSAKAYFRRGQARRHLNEFKAARADLQKALELSGGDAGIQKELNLLDKTEKDQTEKDKKMYKKMFG